MGSVDQDWFEPARLFDDGYPEGITSALRALPGIRRTVREEISRAGARRILEIGPGDAPVADGLPGAVFLDVAPIFLRRLAGARVRGDLFAAPFAPGAFDLVVASDVLTHIRPGRRAEALDRLLALGGDLLVFNPEPGTARVGDSPSPTRPILDFAAARGWRAESRKFVASTPGGDYVMRLVIARRV
jgi:hypothetical protein